MYLLSEVQILPLMALLLIWGTGGWLMTLRWFDLEPHERGFVGFGLGLVLANWMANFLVRLLPMNMVFWVSGLLTLALGLVSAWPLNRELIRSDIKTSIIRWLSFAGAVVLFTLMGRGLGLFDDFHNLPTTSLMATGDIPPHLPGSPDVRYGYHYFLILLGVQLMRVAAAAPWTALDLARGITLALAMILAGLLAWRLTRRQLVAWISAAFFLFAGGTRWLLLLLPVALLNRISASITLLGSARDTASNFAEALTRPWNAIGSGPIPFPFAFSNGVHDPAIMAHYGYGVSQGMIMLLLLLLADRHKTWKTGLLFVALLASLALANEVDFVLLYLGMLLAGILWAARRRTLQPPRSAWLWIVVAALAGIAALVQGGFLTEAFRTRIAGVSPEASYFTAKFFLIAPAVIATHLGKLSLFNPYQFVAAVFEVGPVVLALPLVLIWGYRALQEEHWIHASLAAAAIPSLLSIFLEYSGNADITATTRLLWIMISLCKILGVPLVWLWLQNQAEWKHRLAQGLIAVSMFAGIVLFSIQLIAIPRPVYTVFVTDMDAAFYQKYWDRLSPPAAWVLDPISQRSATIFGRQSDALVGWGVSKPEYVALLENPDPYQLSAAGYRFVYADKEYWKQYDAQLEQACVRVLETIEGVKVSRSGAAPDFRRLADISECK